MIEGATMGFWAGLGGAAIGLAGGVFGTWCSLRASRGPREHAFLVRAAVAFWIGALTFMALMMVLPDPQRYWLWVPYAPLLTWSVIVTNRRHARARAEDASASGGEASESLPGSPEASR